MTSVPTSAGVALSSQALYRLLVITGLTSDILNSVDCWFFLAEVYRIRISGLESGRIQHILNKSDWIRTTVLFNIPDQDQDFQISFFSYLTPTQS